MKIFKAKAGVISPEPCWVCFHSCYIYTADTFLGLLWAMITQWNDDSNLVG